MVDDRPEDTGSPPDSGRPRRTPPTIDLKATEVSSETQPAAADAPTLDELLEKISAMALDLLPDNHPDVAPESLFLQITALREAEPAAG